MLKTLETTFERLIFASRWLQAPLYAGLVVAQVAYSWMFGIELVHLIGSMGDPRTNAKIFLGGVLELIDFLMVANLIIMVVIGGYATFVSKLDLADHADRPDWLQHIDPGTIKVKLAGSLIGISSIQLLQSFIHLATITRDAAGVPIPLDPAQVALEHEQIRWQIILHIVFVILALMLALTEMVMHRRQRPGTPQHAASSVGAPEMG